jgi:hypothetical protein
MRTTVKLILENVTGIVELEPVEKINYDHLDSAIGTLATFIVNARKANSVDHSACDTALVGALNTLSYLRSLIEPAR